MVPYRIFLSFGTLLVTTASPAQALHLRFHPPVGKTVQYIGTTSVEMSIGDSAQPIRFTESVPVTFSVTSYTGRLTTLGMRTGQAKVSASPGSPFERKKAEMERKVSGLTSIATVDELGNILGSDNSFAVTGGLVQGIQGITFPRKAVKVGDTWSGTLDLSHLGKSLTGEVGSAHNEAPVTYRLTSLTRGIATVRMDARGTAYLGTGTRRVRIIARHRATYKFDTATGLLIEMESTSDNDLAPYGEKMIHQHLSATMRLD